MKIGYARVSTHEQNLDMQVITLENAGCEKIYEEKVSGVKVDRSILNNLIQQLRSNDVLVIWKLDRLGRLNFTAYERLYVHDASRRDFFL